MPCRIAYGTCQRVAIGSSEQQPGQCGRRVLAARPRHLAAATPRQQRFELARRAIAPGVDERLAAAGQTHGHGFQAGPSGIDAPHQHLFDRNMSRQHGGDVRSRLADVDVPAGFLPNTQQQFS